MRRTIALLSLLTGSCTYQVGVLDLRDQAASYVSPPVVVVAPLAPGECPDPTCCRPGGAATGCCGRFEIGVRGRNTLVAMGWLPGAGSDLTILHDHVGRIDPAPNELAMIPLCYELPVSAVQACKDAADGALCETGLPPDDGILRIYFEDSPTIDILVQAQ